MPLSNVYVPMHWDKHNTATVHCLCMRGEMHFQQ